MAPSKFPLDEAQLVALFMESVFYGIYLVTFFACIRALLWSEGHIKASHTINWKMVAAALAMLVFGTMDLGFGLRHNLEAFIYFGGDPEIHFADTAYWVNVMKMVTYVCQTFIGDSILLYRCWVVWNHNWWVVVGPILLWLGTTVCGIVTIYIEFSLRNDAALLNSRQLIPFISSMLTLTLATNLVTTSLIVYRIWSIQSAIRHRGTTTSKGPLEKLIRVLVESGLLYTLSIVILFGCYLTSNNAQLGVSDSVVQIIGITFNLVILSVNRNKPQGQSTVNQQASLSLPMSYPPQGRYMINIERSVIRHASDDIEAKGESPTTLNQVPLTTMPFGNKYNNHKNDN